MQIVCNQCKAEYEIDPPAAPFARMQDLVFRCTACGASVPIHAAPTEASKPRHAAPRAPVGQFVLKQNGKTYTVGDAAVLQRWIAERRVGTEDRVSVDGGAFGRVGDLEQFAVFFKLVADAERSAVAAEPTAVPEPYSAPQEPAPTAPSAASKSRGKSLFARPAGVTAASGPFAAASPAKTRMEPADPPEPSTPVLESSDSPATAATAAHDVLADVTARVAAPSPEPEDERPIVAEADADDDATTALDAAAVSVDVEEWGLGEALPDDEADMTAALKPDDDTMDMELDEEDFFSEDRMSLAMQSMDDDDGDLEWGQTRRSNMAVWWLLFLGGLGGSGFVALEWLNQSDQADAAEQATAIAPTGEPTTEVTQPVVGAGVDEDSGSNGAADEPAPTAAEPAPAGDSTPPASDAAAADPDPPTNPPAAPTDASTPAPNPPAVKAPPPTKPSPPAKPSAGREAERGWAQIDRGNWDGARRHFNTALAVNRSHPDARLGLAYVNEHQGRVDEAVRQYCSLASTAAGDVKNEANGRLRSLDRVCP